MKCPKHNGRWMTEAKLPHFVKVSGITFTATLSGEKCGQCGYSAIRDAALAVFETKVADFLIDEGHISGSAFRFIRKRLGLTIEEVGTIVDVRHETVCRWENGKRDVGRVSFMVLASIFKEKLQGRSDLLGRLVRERSKNPKPDLVAIGVV